MKVWIYSLLIFTIVLIALSLFVDVETEPDDKDLPWMNANLTPQERAQELIKKMSFLDKYNLIHGGTTNFYVGNVPKNRRLKIPAIRLEDGPQGVADKQTKVTVWPSALSVAASWDTQLMYYFGQYTAQEQVIKGTNVQLGPMMNIARIPRGGRNFESFGEDPFLSGEMAYNYIQGVQDQGIIACAKHWAFNNQEHHRKEISVSVDEKTSYELYYPQFKRAIEAGVGSFMCSYNKVNGTHACENEHLLTQDLKKTFNYSYWVMSDWFANHASAKSINAGLDQEMPVGLYFFTVPFEYMIGLIKEDRLNDMVYRILVPMFTMGIFDRASTGKLSNDARSKEHTVYAQVFATKANVLLKNDDKILPINPKQVKTVAIVGDDAHKSTIISGHGSGHVECGKDQITTPWEGITTYAQKYNISFTLANTDETDQAISNAKAADYTVYFVGVNSQEGKDRKSLSLPDADNALIEKLIPVAKNLVVILHNPGAVIMPWIDQVKGVIAAFYPGQETGNAAAQVLFGQSTPSGKLPLSFPKSETGFWANTPEQYPGVHNKEVYSEKLFVGYRYYDQYPDKEQAQFPFGHGLSYTSFYYDNLELISNQSIGLAVTNNGSMSGVEIVQLYVEYPQQYEQPPKLLKGFQKIFLNQGETTNVEFTITGQQLNTWSVEQHQYVNATGDFTFLIGSSSRDIRQQIMCYFNGTIITGCYD